MVTLDPIISIIVPVYNIEKHLRKCLDSILVQTFLDFEVLVVNDGSTDNSGEIGDEYEKKDKRIKVIHQPNRGVSAARNTGVDYARGTYIGFVDGDDYVDDRMYESLFQLCKETDSEISICKLGREINGKQTEKREEDIYIRELNHLEAMQELFKGEIYRFSLCNKLFHRSCFAQITFPEGRIHEDLSTTYKLFANAQKSVYTNFIGYIYVKRENSILTTSYYEKRLDAFVGWDEIIVYMERNYPQLEDQFIPSFTYWGIDNIYCILQQVIEKESRKKYLHVIQVYIRKYYREIMKSKLLTLKYKTIISIFCMNKQLFSLSHRMRNTKTQSLEEKKLGI